MDLNQKIFKYLIYYPVVILRHENVPIYLKELIQSQYFPTERLHEIQLRKLKYLIKYAKENVPFHIKNLKNISEKDITQLKDIKEIPFTTKELIKNSPELLTSKEPFKLLTKKTTGGTTGGPAIIWKTADAMGQELAATWRAYKWAGIEIGERQGRFWGIPFGYKDQLRARLIDFICNRKRCSAISFDEINLETYTKMLTKFNPKYFYGYPEMFAEYAKYFIKKNTIPPFNLKCIISTSEVLTTYHRKLIQDVFNTRVFNEYGSGELGSVAHECENGSMHIMAENMIVEVLDGERQCNLGEIGELVITELNNRAMPLIRYRTGDFASPSDIRCECGRSLPVIENIAGRASDIIKNKHGRMFESSFFIYIFEEAQEKKLGVGAYQVIQLDSNKLKIKIQPEKQYSKETEYFIEDKIRKGFDPNVLLEFEKVNSISRENSGKTRIVIGMESNKEDSSSC